MSVRARDSQTTRRFPCSIGEEEEGEKMARYRHVSGYDSEREVREARMKERVEGESAAGGGEADEEEDAIGEGLVESWLIMDW
jgi:hypothetical protein